jgi:iron complex transport system ATP-binding protein
MPLEIKNLKCSYSDKALFKNITLSLSEHTTLLGANGSGKSSLARAICSLIEYEGSIALDGVDLKSLGAKQRAKELFYLPAKLDVYDSSLSVFEFVLLSRFAHKDSFFSYTSKDKALAREALEKLSLTHLQEHALGSLSSGESALVLLASALCAQSKLLILDEPTANLDPHNAKVIAQHIKELKKERQIFLITHDLHLACYIQSPLLFLKEGNFLQFEDPKEFFNDATLQELYGVEFRDLAVVYA